MSRFNFFCDHDPTKTTKNTWIFIRAIHLKKLSENKAVL